jgi:polar amino acid transport system substrate-binding protein
MNTNRYRLTILLAMASLPSVSLAQTPVVVMSIDSMPQASAADGRGIMADAAMEALKRVGLAGKLEFPPWGRAQETVQAGKDVLITGLSRTPERESLYTWLFPVFTMYRGFATTDAPAANFAEAKAKYKHIAIPAHSAQYDELVREGFSVDQFNTLQFEKQPNIPALLVAGRVDAWFTSIPEMKYSLKGNPDASKIVIGSPVDTGTTQYMACSKDCDAALVTKLKQAGEDMKTDGTMQTIIAHYQ